MHSGAVQLGDIPYNFEWKIITDVRSNNQGVRLDPVSLAEQSDCLFARMMPDLIIIISGLWSHKWLWWHLLWLLHIYDGYDDTMMIMMTMAWETSMWLIESLSLVKFLRWSKVYKEISEPAQILLFSKLQM